MAQPRCPICGEPSAERDAEPFPFCSRRCKLVDLGNWLGEHYRVPEAHVSPEDVSEAGWDGEGNEWSGPGNGR